MDPPHVVGGFGRRQDGSASARGFCHQACFLLCCESNHQPLYLKLSHRYIIVSQCRSLSICALLIVSPLLVYFYDLWLAIIKLDYCYTIPFLCLDRMT